MILSDRSIREAVAAGRIGLEPFDDALVQPSSVDVRLDRLFRVFRNHTAGVIDVKKDLTGLTEEVEIDDSGVFMLHPGEFVLGSTLEQVRVPDDLVARIEGKSSLGRLGLLIHSSLPASEPLLVLDDEGLVLRTMGEIVKHQRPCSIVGFDPTTFEVGYHRVTGWYESAPDRVYEIRLRSGRSVRVSAGHNVFSLDDAGELRRVRTAELAVGTQIAIARDVPDPAQPVDAIDLLGVIPEAERDRLVVSGPRVAAAFASWPREIGAVLRSAGYDAVSYYRSRSALPFGVAAQLPGLLAGLGDGDRIARRGERHSLPARVGVDAEIAWLLGMYVAEGSRRRTQVTISNTDQLRLDRLTAIFATLGLPVTRAPGAVRCCSTLLSDLIGWLGTGDGAATKRVPPAAFGWSRPIVEAFLGGVADGDGSRSGGRTSVRTTSAGLVADLLLLFSRLGRRAGCTRKVTDRLPVWQVYATDWEHELFTSVPLPQGLLQSARAEAGLSQRAAAIAAGSGQPTDLDNLEQGCGRDAIRFATVRRLHQTYAHHGAGDAVLAKLARLTDGGVAWDRVVEVVDTGCVEPLFDLEVRPAGRTIENFLAGRGGVFVSNTAGFVDSGFQGHITLELANVASLPITLYPGMKIGQISFMQMTTPADRPYGKGATGSKYQGQRGPTPSRYFENFRE